MAALGALILWFGWFGFNGGANGAMDLKVPLILINTFLSASFGLIFSSIMGVIIMKKPEPKKYLNAIKAYKGGLSKIEGVDKIFKLSSNENPFGPSSNAILEYEKIANDLGLYPDSSNSELKLAISHKYKIDSDRIICGCGSDEILHLLARVYLDEGNQGLVSENAFAVYPLAIQSSGATVVRAKEEDFQPNIDNFISSLTDETKIIYIANPNNPTGSYINFDEIKRLYNSISDDVLLVIDAAYSEYVEENDYSIGFDLAKESENIVITKTFSKAFGLAGLRVGWAYCPKKIAERLDILKVPFSVNTAAQMAAISALKDDEHINFSVEHNSKWKNILKDSFTNIGLIVYPSQCNFLLVEFVDSFKVSAKEAYQILCSKGIIVREMEEYNLPNCLRISIGEEEANLLLLETVNALK